MTTAGNKLQLEVRDGALPADQLGHIGEGVMMTPAIGEDFWIFRVKVSDTQAILGFPKFGTIGIGFAEEEDWNTNLPYRCSTDEIWQHIDHNKGDDAIDDATCVAAIEMVQAAAHRFKGTDPVDDGLPPLHP